MPTAFLPSNKILVTRTPVSVDRLLLDRAGLRYALADDHLWNDDQIGCFYFSETTTTNFVSRWLAFSFDNKMFSFLLKRVLIKNP